jgi:hypothetical protein
MGCFLIMTEEDFNQLSSKMRAGVSFIRTKEAGKVLVQVGGTTTTTVQQMAAEIRGIAPSAEVSAVSPAIQQRAVPSIERFATTVETLAEFAPFAMPFYLQYANETTSNAMRSYGPEIGKMGEQAAQTIVLHLDDNVKITKTAVVRGIDIKAERGDENVLVYEVKTSIQEKSFAQLLGKGYDHRQVSDPWIQAVDKTIDLETVVVRGIHINPVTETVTIYERKDRDAKEWDCIIRDAPLSKFNIKLL